MVRLKVIEISRDFSSIARFQFLMVRLKEMSRTYGRNLDLQFQFLMVRLKGVRVSEFADSWIISIPYGAIKSIL